MNHANSVSRSTRPRRRLGDSEIDRWIRTRLAAEPPKARSLIVTVWGDAIAPHGGAVWLSGLIRLMAPFGISERLTRTSVYRLVQEGWLTARQDGRRSLYRLTPQGARRFEHAYRRIYAPPGAAWNGCWDVVISPPAALHSAQRAMLRKELWWEGFGAAAPGLFMRPSRAGQSSVDEIVAALGLGRGAWALEGRELGGRRKRALPAIAAECWNLGHVRDAYRAFIARFEGVLGAFRRVAALDPEQCFVVRTLLIHAFRRAMLHDPQLPAELLPADWPGRAAYALCRDLYRRTHKPAERHLAATLETREGPLPRAAPYFYRRFGGI